MIISIIRLFFNNTKKIRLFILTLKRVISVYNFQKKHWRVKLHVINIFFVMYIKYIFSVTIKCAQNIFQSDREQSSIL